MWNGPDDDDDQESSGRGYVENLAHQAAKGVVNAGTAIAEGDPISAIGETVKLPLRIAGAVLGTNRDDDD